jgi:hypothetical protein
MNSTKEVLSNKNRLKINIQNEMREELEKELDTQANYINSGKYPDMTQKQINHLNYYNEIAKQNIRYMMNSPSMKEINRITSDESCLEKLKQKLQSKELQQLLDQLPLMRVKRINIKNKEIGNMRRDLAKFNQNNLDAHIDRKKGEEFASNIFSRRIKEGEKYNPVKLIDNLYNNEENQKLNKTQNTRNVTNNRLIDRNRNNSEIWNKKIRINNFSVKKNNENNNNNNEVKNGNERKLNRKRSCGPEYFTNKTRAYYGCKRNNRITNIINNNENKKANTKDENKNNNVNKLENMKKEIGTCRRSRDNYGLRRNHSTVSVSVVTKKEETIKMNLKKQLEANIKNENRQYLWKSRRNLNRTETNKN